jgi:hypothetical protein
MALPWCCLGAIDPPVGAMVAYLTRLLGHRKAQPPAYTIWCFFTIRADFRAWHVNRCV